MEGLSFDRNNAPLNNQATTTFLIQSFSFQKSLRRYVIVTWLNGAKINDSYKKQITS